MEKCKWNKKMSGLAIISLDNTRFIRMTSSTVFFLTHKASGVFSYKPFVVVVVVLIETQHKQHIN